MPRDGIEREFKAMLADGAERDRLAALIGGPSAVLRQRNVLFDTADRRLGAAGLSLRLRHENLVWILTGKGEPRTRRSDPLRLLAQRGEAERPVAPALATHLVAGTADPLPLLRRAEPAPVAVVLAEAMEKAADGRPLVVVGEFRNERTLLATALPCGTPVSVALDRSEMPDGSIEHELEVEIARASVERAASWLVGLLGRAEIPLRPAASKRLRYARALARTARDQRGA